MSDNPIVEEIRAIKHKLAAECDNDITKIMERTRNSQENDGRKYIQLPLRPENNTSIPPLDAANNSSVDQPTE